VANDALRRLADRRRRNQPNCKQNRPSLVHGTAHGLKVAGLHFSAWPGSRPHGVSDPPRLHPKKFASEQHSRHVSLEASPGRHPGKPSQSCALANHVLEPAAVDTGMPSHRASVAADRTKSPIWGTASNGSREHPATVGAPQCLASALCRDLQCSPLGSPSSSASISYASKQQGWKQASQLNILDHQQSKDKRCNSHTSAATPSIPRLMGAFTKPTPVARMESHHTNQAPLAINSTHFVIREPPSLSGSGPQPKTSTCDPLDSATRATPTTSCPPATTTGIHRGRMCSQSGCSTSSNTGLDATTIGAVASSLKLAHRSKGMLASNRCSHCAGGHADLGSSSEAAARGASRLGTIGASGSTKFSPPLLRCRGSSQALSVASSSTAALAASEGGTCGSPSGHKHRSPLTVANALPCHSASLASQVQDAPYTDTDKPQRSCSHARPCAESLLPDSLRHLRNVTGTAHQSRSHALEARLLKRCSSPPRRVTSAAQGTPSRACSSCTK
jgi:hypothetical protein